MPISVLILIPIAVPISVTILLPVLISIQLRVPETETIIVTGIVAVILPTEISEPTRVRILLQVTFSVPNYITIPVQIPISLSFKFSSCLNSYQVEIFFSFLFYSCSGSLHDYVFYMFGFLQFQVLLRFRFFPVQFNFGCKFYSHSSFCTV
jgi:hypothetical protein